MKDILYGTFHDLDPQQVERRFDEFFGATGASLEVKLDRFGAETSQILMAGGAAYEAFQLQAADGIAAAGRELESADHSLTTAETQAAV